MSDQAQLSTSRQHSHHHTQGILDFTTIPASQSSTHEDRSIQERLAHARRQICAYHLQSDSAVASQAGAEDTTGTASSGLPVLKQQSLELSILAQRSSLALDSQNAQVQQPAFPLNSTSLDDFRKFQQNHQTQPSSVLRSFTIFEDFPKLEQNYQTKPPSFPRNSNNLSHFDSNFENLSKQEPSYHSQGHPSLPYLQPRSNPYTLPSQQHGQVTPPYVPPAGASDSNSIPVHVEVRINQEHLKKHKEFDAQSLENQITTHIVMSCKEISDGEWSFPIIDQPQRSAHFDSNAYALPNLIEKILIDGVQDYHYRNKLQVDADNHSKDTVSTTSSAAATRDPISAAQQKCYLKVDQVRFIFYFYSLHDPSSETANSNLDETENQQIQGNTQPDNDEDEDEDEDSSQAYQIQLLPAPSLEGLWEVLQYDCQIKINLLDYVVAAQKLAKAKVNPIKIAWNRVVLLYGPPGTGKTSLCKALAQKLAIRLNETNDTFFKPSQRRKLFLVEINAHSLFSKWFSESGKLVGRVFQRIRHLADANLNSFVCVLIDEVESLTAARKAALSGSEPSDAIRVVNALLTQVDTLQSKHNVLLLATSNITEAIDDAFVDRADIMQFVGQPNSYARRQILQTGIEELMRVGLLCPPPKKPHISKDCDWTLMISDQYCISLLNQAVEAAEGMSGRSIKKLPFLACAAAFRGPIASLPCAEFLEFLLQAIKSQINAKSKNPPHADVDVDDHQSSDP